MALLVVNLSTKTISVQHQIYRAWRNDFIISHPEIGKTIYTMAWVQVECWRYMVYTKATVPCVFYEH
jgi:hypothetical protein